MHQDEATSQIQQFKEDKDKLTEELKQQHDSELLDVQKANKLAVASLREQLELEREASLQQMAGRHAEDMSMLRDELSAQHQAEVAGLRGIHENDINTHRQQLRDMLELRKSEVSLWKTLHYNSVVIAML